MTDTIDTVIPERDRILTELDVEAAKAFIATHGGTVDGHTLDWARVLHLARFEATSLSQELREESQMYLARTGAQSVRSLSRRSPYLQMAMELLLPRDAMAAYWEGGAS